MKSIKAFETKQEENLLCSVWYVPKFLWMYNKKQNIYCAPHKCLQKVFGYNNFYDLLARIFVNIRTQKIFFEYENRKWRVQLWKGQYGITTGAEIGVYYKDARSVIGHYHSVMDDDMLYMSLKLYKNDEELFRISRGVYWWINGFKCGWITNPSELTLEAEIVFLNASMRELFEVNYIERYGAENISILSEDTVLIRW